MDQAEQQDAEHKKCHKEVGVEERDGVSDIGETFKTDVREKRSQEIKKEIRDHQTHGIQDKGVKARHERQGRKEKDPRDAHHRRACKGKQDEVFQIPEPAYTFKAILPFGPALFAEDPIPEIDGGSHRTKIAAENTAKE
jgi:hypothetical protein